MKKLIAAMLAILCLAGCAAKEAPAPAPVQPEPPAVTAPAETPEAEPETDGAPLAPVEIPMETPEEAPEEAPETKPEPASYASTILEGLGGDAVGYALELPSFGYDAFDQFYEKLIAHLEEYARQTVHEACIERNCVANVFGAVTAADYVDGKLAVTYEVRVEYSDSDAPVVNTRTDTFDPETGALSSQTQ